MKPSQSRQAPIKILNIAETIKGGIATYLAELELGQQVLSCEFAHLIPAVHSGELKALRVFTHQGSRSLLGLMKLMFKTVLTQRSYRADIVFAHSTFAGIVLCVVKPLLGRNVRTIYCPHGWSTFREMPNWKRRLVAAVERAMSFVPTRVINISKFEHESVSALGFSDQSVLIPNAVSDRSDFRDSDSMEARPIRVLYVGRFDRQKGIDILLEAIALLESQGFRGVEFDLVGGGVLEGDVPALLLAPPPHVTYHGWLGADEIHQRYKAADVLVMPSRWEGFGLCAVEALRAGTPVLARRVGGLSEIAVENESGYFFEGGAGELCDALRQLDLDNLRKMRAAARSRFDDLFRIERFYGQYQKLIGDLASVNDVGNKKVGG